MPKTLVVEDLRLSVREHVSLIESGDYGLPEFQRTFVWDDQRVLRLWESLHLGYPIGQFMLWQPTGVDFPMRSLGRDQQPLAQNAQHAVIDGQQRLTAIWLVLKGDIRLRYHLERQQFFYGLPSESSIGLDILRDRTVEEADAGNYFFLKATGDQQQRFAPAVNALNATFANRTVPYQTIKNAPYPTAVGIFKRVNQQGEPLSEAQLALAGISSRWSGVFRRTFDLLRRLNDEMGFDKVEDPDFIIRAWTAVHTGQHMIKHLSPEEGIRSRYAEMATEAHYEDSWARLERGVAGLIHVMRDRLGLTNFQFVKAYFPLIVVINYFAHREQVPEEDLERLVRWLLMSFIQSRYSVRALSKLREDIRSTGPEGGLSALFAHRWEALNPETFALDERVLVRESFKSAYPTLLYILMRKAGAADWLRPELAVGDPAVPWHFHHIFPQENFDGDRAALRNQLEVVRESGSDDEEIAVKNEMQALEERVNSVANLAFLTPESNSTISSRLPSEYLAEICSKPGGEDLLRRQFIPLDRELLKHESYPAFCEARRRLIVEAANGLLGL